MLSNPADRWPRTIGRVGFFRKYPYFLPCLVAGCVPQLAAILALLFFREVSIIILSLTWSDVRYSRPIRCARYLQSETARNILRRNQLSCRNKRQRLLILRHPSLSNDPKGLSHPPSVLFSAAVSSSPSPTTLSSLSSINALPS